MASSKWGMQKQTIREVRTTKPIFDLPPSDKKTDIVIQLSYVNDNYFYILYQGKHQSEIVKYNLNSITQPQPIYRENQAIFGFAVDEQQEKVYLSNRKSSVIEVWSIKKKVHLKRDEINLHKLGKSSSQLKLRGNRMIICLEREGAILMNRQQDTWCTEWRCSISGLNVISSDILNEETMLICDDVSKSILMINWKNNCIIKKINQLIYPIEIISFQDDETFIVCNESSKIDMFNKDGILIKSLKFQLPYSPQRMTYNHEKHQLIFTYGQSEKMLGIF